MQVIESIGFFQLQKRKTLVEVALNGTQVDVEFFGERLGAKLFALIQLFHNLNQTVTKGVVIRCFYGGHVGWS